jgi:hypothetical protein
VRLTLQPREDQSMTNSKSIFLMVCGGVLALCGLGLVVLNVFPPVDLVELILGGLMTACGVAIAVLAARQRGKRVDARGTGSSN